MSWKRKPNRLATTIPARVSDALLARLDWLVIHDGEVVSRSQAARDGLRGYVEWREDTCRRNGLAPPTPRDLED
ncbi:hypothetical protein [Bradyrhizobium liaoningense]|uniref:hypothetical protein n=1 Tax=Bradyrhizobium liaoningense TaxID=43992 RepID=UPI001BAB5EB9|nr:hypothetical protein [Bradyrhizobium liaoningense]MBR0712695.1 hypothetical protein [Bradyrhizobium liaoningense]